MQAINNKLFYKNCLVATLINPEIKWPRSDAIYKVSEGLGGELEDYIQFSIEYSILVKANNDEALQNHLDKEEKFNHLMEADDWCIVDSNCKKYSILPPIFHPENVVVFTVQ